MSKFSNNYFVRNLYYQWDEKDIMIYCLGYQNVYSRMCGILDIENLIKDLEESEEQLAILQNMSAAKSEKMASEFLFGISLLSLFSALVDAAGYFDRIPFLSGLATRLSFMCVAAIVSLCLVWLYKKR